jgi:hypothetical protein
MSIQRVPLRSVADVHQQQRVAESINGLIDGKLDAVSSVTLTVSSATTVVADNRFESTMALFFTATTANAAAAVGGMYVSSRGEGTFTLTHANDANADKTFLYLRVG